MASSLKAASALKTFGLVQASSVEAEAYWQRHGNARLKTFLIAPELPTWIETATEPFAVGCLVCRAHSKHQAGDWATCSVCSCGMLHEAKFRTHETSQWHREAVAALLGSVDATLDDVDNATPSVAEFKKVLQHLKKAPIGIDGVPGVAGWRKCRQMSWCLAEGGRILKRLVWRAGGLVSTTIFQDGRKGKLTVRMKAAGDTLQRCNGYMGTVDLARDHSLDAIGIQAGTIAVINKFCTPRFAPPPVPGRLESNK